MDVDVTALTCKELDELLPAYVLGALGADESAAVARHMRACDKHMESLEGYTAVVDGLSISGPLVDPPPHLRARLLASTAPPRASRRRVEPRAWLGWAVAAAAVVVAVVSGVWALSLQRQSDNLTALQAQLAELARRPDAHMIPLEATEGNAAKGVLIFAGSEAAVWAVALPPLESDEVFGCWWVGQDGKTESAGTFRSSSGGGVWFISMPEDIGDYRMFGITLEPERDTPEPQGPRLLAGDL